MNFIEILRINASKMKVIYETYRRHRQNSSNNKNNNNNNNNNHIEICHSNESLMNTNNNKNNGYINNNNNNVDISTTSSTSSSTADQHHLMNQNLQQSQQQQQQYRHIISIDSLVINKELGVGEFGVVQQGVWTNDDGKRIQVAIKCLSASRLENSCIEFLKEASIMHSISNEHIVQLYGVVLEPSVMLITELAPLRSLLECLKEPTLITHFPLTSLCLFAEQIADGMAYLESKRLIHRDLAARNILVFNKTKVKISDFGLSRALGVGKDYYQSNFNVNLKLPIAWCAPECINYLKFTSQSDVWAYGVTLWEMFSFGFQPWAALTGQQILEAIDMPNYQRLERPECCPKEYYQLMLDCWAHEPNLRPKFSEIVQLLPDCKPELLQAIKNSDNNNNNNYIHNSNNNNNNQNQTKDFLHYKSGDIVTVIDKDHDDHHYYDTNNEPKYLWKGVTNDRKTGLINPSDFVAYLGQNLPSTNNNNNNNHHHHHHNNNHSSNSNNNNNNHSSNNNNNHNNNHHHHHHHHHSASSLASTITSTVLQSSKFLRGFLDIKNHSSNGHSNSNNSNDHSPNGLRKQSHHHHHQRLRPEMISRPQGDLKHTGHVGVDGLFFGDVSFLDGKYNSITKLNGNHSSSSTAMTTTKHEQSIESNKSNNNNNRKLTISGPIPNFNRNSVVVGAQISNNSKAIYSNSNHEYHEISDDDDDGDNDNNNNDDDDDMGALESPPFEILDFGPSLMEEVFRELDHIKPDLNNDTGDSEIAINENSINVKNEVRELNLKISKESNNLKKKQSSVKPISEAEQNELDSAIAMAKDIANRTMLDDHNLDMTKNDSPKTPNSPNKQQKKFSFKFPVPVTGHHAKNAERRTFSEETESIGNIIESITPAAKEAYMSLVDKGVSSSSTPASLSSSNIVMSASALSTPAAPASHAASTASIDFNHSHTNSINSPNNYNDEDDNIINDQSSGIENNPLRMLRTAGIGKVLRPKIRGNRSFSQPRLPTTAQTAGLARVASSRSPIGMESSNTNVHGESNDQRISFIQAQQQNNSNMPSHNQNALPLPPRDRSRPLIQLKTHQRRHPLVIPAELSDKMNNVNNNNTNHQQQQQQSHMNMIGNDNNNNNSSSMDGNQNNNFYPHQSYEISSTLGHRHVPVLKQVSCPQVPAAFLHKTSNVNQNNNEQHSGINENLGDSIHHNNKSSIQQQQPSCKSTRSYLSDDLTESLESEIQKAFDNIKLKVSSSPILAATTTVTPPITSTTTAPQSIITKPQSINEQQQSSSSTSTFAVPSTFTSSTTPTIPSSTTSATSNDNIIAIKTNAAPIIKSANPINTNHSQQQQHHPPPPPPPPSTTATSKHRTIDSDEVRVMQKVLSNEINLKAEECAKILDSTDWDIHKAIKCIRLRQQLRNHNIIVDCDLAKMLQKFNWNIRQASNYLIATQGVPEDTTEV